MFTFFLSFFGSFGIKESILCFCYSLCFVLMLQEEFLTLLLRFVTLFLNIFVGCNFILGCKRILVLLVKRVALFLRKMILLFCETKNVNS